MILEAGWTWQEYRVQPSEFVARLHRFQVDRAAAERQALQEASKPRG